MEGDWKKKCQDGSHLLFPRSVSLQFLSSSVLYIYLEKKVRKYKAVFSGSTLFVTFCRVIRVNWISNVGSILSTRIFKFEVSVPVPQLKEGLYETTYSGNSKQYASSIYIYMIPRSPCLLLS